MKIVQTPDGVEFHETFGYGTSIVQVLLSTPTPRVKIFFSSGDGEIRPLSMFIDQVNGLVLQAQSIRRGAKALEKRLEA
jgi:hypothetical protein